MGKPFAAAVLAAFLFPAPAGGQEVQPRCGQRVRLLGRLAAKYQEAPVAVGVTSAGGPIAAGKGWRAANRTPEGPDT